MQSSFAGENVCNETNAMGGIERHNKYEKLNAIKNKMFNIEIQK
jgi:hypothetical protein